jgi:uncharacterized protein YqgC (DUF456 family)
MEALDTVAWILWSIGFVTVGVAVLGALLPMVPGTPLLYGLVILIGLQSGWDQVWWPLAIVTFATLSALALDFLGTMLGAKLGGGGKAAIIGSVIGLVVVVLGLIPATFLGGPLIGVILGPILGAWLGEAWARQRAGSTQALQEAFKPAMGTLVGGAVGTILKSGLTFVAGAWLLYLLWP